jgi:hypothetical protein
MQINEHGGYSVKYGTGDTPGYIKMPHGEPAVIENGALEFSLGGTQTAAWRTGIDGTEIDADQPDTQQQSGNISVARQDREYGANEAVSDTERRTGERAAHIAGASPGAAYPANANTGAPAGEPQDAKYAARSGVPGNSLPDTSDETKPPAKPVSQISGAAPAATPVTAPVVSGAGGSRPLFIEPKLFRTGIQFLARHKSDVGAIEFAGWSHIHQNSVAALEYRELRTDIYKILGRIRVLSELDIRLLNSVVDAFEAVDNQ